MKAHAGGTPYALGTETPRGFHVRRIMFGKLAASMDRRDGEQIRAVKLRIADKPSNPVAPLGIAEVFRGGHRTGAMIENHNSGQYLAVVDQTAVLFARGYGRRSPGGPAGWYVIRTCPCHDRLPVTRRYDTRDQAEAAALLLIAVSAGLGT